MNTTEKQHTLRGVIPALITPLDDHGNLDLRAFEKHVAYLSAAGVHGFFVNGTTGEGAYLSLEEKLTAYKLVRDVSAGAQVLCAACIQPSTAMVLQEIQAFEALAPDYIVAVTPYYGTVSQDVIVEHYRTIAQHAPAPVILYNIPSRTHNTIALDTVARLASVENIAGLKDSSGNFIDFSRGIYADFPPHFAWIQGDDLLDGPSLLVGAQGVVTGLGNVWITPYLDMYRAARAGELAAVHQAQRQINALFEIIARTQGKVLPAIKAGVELQGRSLRHMKLAPLRLRDDEVVLVKEVLDRLGVLS